MAEHIVEQLSHALEPENTLEGFVRQLLKLLHLVTGMESTYLTRIDMDTETLYIVYARNSQADNLIPEGEYFPWDDSLCKRALDSDTSFEDKVPERWSASVRASSMGINTYMSTPVILENGSLYGTLCAISREHITYTEHGEQILRLFANLIARYIEKDEILHQLQSANDALVYHSYTDDLTDLPNRRSVYENLVSLFTQCLKEERVVLVCYIDLDGFKSINDQYGHEAGDALLVAVGRRLRMATLPGDIIGRIGGDEFLVARKGPAKVTSPTEAIGMMKHQFGHLLEGQYSFPIVSFHYQGASIGIAAIDPAERWVDDAMKQADAAMYAEKEIRKQPRQIHAAGK